MAVEIVPVPEDENAEVGRVAEDARDREAGFSGGVQGGRRAKVREALQVDGAVGLELVDSFHVQNYEGRLTIQKCIGTAACIRSDARPSDQPV